MLKRFAICSLLSITSLDLGAACPPETIQFYLDKGFTQEQITKLCAQSSDATPTYEPYQKPVVVVQEGYSDGSNSVEERKAISELRGSLAGRSLDVTNTHINYITQVCVRAGNSPEIDQRIDKCIDVAFSIARSGLKTTHSGASLLLFGQQNVEVQSSNIKRKTVVADPWDKYPPDIKYLLQRKYESQEKGNTTNIPLRKSASPDQAVSALRTLSALTVQRETGDSESEVAKVLDENYVPPTEEEYLATQPTYEEVQEKKENRKKWWNPFD